MYLDVVAFAVLPSCKLYVEFTNGEFGVFDMLPYTNTEFFAELKSEPYFNRAFIEYGVITWPNGQDISPATIRLEMQQLKCPDGIEIKVARTPEYATAQRAEVLC